MYASEKRARLGALNYSVIVSAADCDCLADAELRQDRGRDRLIFRRILNRAGRDDD